VTMEINGETLANKSLHNLETCWHLRVVHSEFGIGQIFRTTREIGN
jgi:hypothetical protein